MCSSLASGEPSSAGARGAGRSADAAALCERALKGDVRAAARIMRELEDRTACGFAALSLLYPRTGKAFVVGITGPPGSGKSTLVDGLIALWRQAGQRVGVV